MKVCNQPTDPWPLDSVILLILWVSIAQREVAFPRVSGTREVVASVLLTPQLALCDSWFQAVTIARTEAQCSVFGSLDGISRQPQPSHSVCPWSYLHTRRDSLCWTFWPQPWEHFTSICRHTLLPKTRVCILTCDFIYPSFQPVLQWPSLAGLF